MRKIGRVVCLIFSILIFSSLFACKGQTEKNSAYNIDCTLNGNVLTATQTVSFVNQTSTALDEVKFNLYPNAFRKDARFPAIAQSYKSISYYNGVNYGDIQIKSALVNNKKADFEVCGEDKNVLSVKLFNQLFPDETVQITLDYTVNLATVIARTGINDKTINLANFYPILCAQDENGFYECVYYSSGDPYYSDCADYTVSITCDSQYVVASSGRQIFLDGDDNMVKRTYQLSNARSFCLVLSSEYKVLKNKVLGIEVNYYYYDDKTPNASMEYAIKSLECFTQKFGAYPYPTYSVCQTKFVQGGMEFPALVMISDQLEKKAYGEVIVHETAHQWWQTTVGNNEIEYSFLDEGLAEYSVVLFYENFEEYGYTRQSLIKSSELTFRTFCSVFDKLAGKVDTSMIRGLYEFSNEYEYVNIAYVKPCLMYDTLRNTLGDENFFKCLKKYYSDFSFKNATPYDLVGCFEKCGADTNGFFETFFKGKEIL